MSMCRWVGVGGVLAVVLISLTQLQPAEVHHHHEALQPAVDPKLAAELVQLRSLLAEQQDASKRQSQLVSQLYRELSAPAVERVPSGAPSAQADTQQAEPPASAEPPVSDATSPAALAAAEGLALSRCTEADVPLLALLRKPCPDGTHGFHCEEPWGLNDQFLPAPSQWLREWNASARAVVDCQRGFFAAFAQRLTLAHSRVEWDAQPFRISAVPPRTIGKMIHQIVTANYYHLTLTPQMRPPLRQAPLPGWNYLKTTQPGFRWNVLDYHADNVFADPLANSVRCDGKPGWHCIWQRFPQQRSLHSAPPLDSPLGKAAHELYNVSMSGTRSRDMLQYLAVAAVTQVFAEPTDATRTYLREHLKLLCHVPGPHCGGTPEELHTPIAAMHVRRGDSCDRERDAAGPFNSMFAWDEKKGRNERVGFRYCYTWRVYREQLHMLQARYGVRTVIIATDDADGHVTDQLPMEKGFNWAFLQYPRKQFKKRGWMEFRKDLTDDVPFSLAAALELLGAADVLVGNMGSHVTRMIYNKMVSASRTSVLPPFISVDGYGLCCDFTEECSKDDIRKRRRSIRDCIHKYGQCTGGDQFFRWSG